MRLYDLVIIIRSSLSEKEKEKLLDNIKSWLGKVKIIKEESWGQKPLAYTIKKEISGIYQKFELEAESIPVELEKKLNTHENILRHLLLRRK